MKIVKSLCILFAIAAFTLSLQSCLDNDSSSELFGICTIRQIHPDSDEYYFVLDDGKTMFPSNGNWNAGKDKDGQRAFVVFEELDEPVKGYDYHITLRAVKEILTKHIVAVGDEGITEKTLGDDKINSTYMWLTNDLKYLTIEYQFKSTLNENKKHFLNLVMSTTEEKEDEAADDFIDLEFRHNNEGDGTFELSEGYVSFKLDRITDQFKDKKGLRIRVNTLNDGIKYYEVPFSSAD